MIENGKKHFIWIIHNNNFHSKNVYLLDITWEESESNGIQVLFGATGFGNGGDVDLKAQLALEHGSPSRAPPVFHPERHRTRHAVA